MSAIFAPFFWGELRRLYSHLGGITIVQAYMYFPHPTDRMSVQVIVPLVAQSLYYYLIPHFGSLAPLQFITPELSAECLISGILTFISQMYFVYQIYSVRRVGVLAWTVIGVLTLFAILTFGCVATMYVFAYGVLADRNKDFAVRLINIFFGLAKGFGAVTDIMATIAMCTFLSNAKTGIRQTDNLIKNLIQYIVERGGVVTLIQTLLLITFYAAPNNLYWLAFHINVTKLYANTFCECLDLKLLLNARKSLWKKHAANRTTAIASSIMINGIEFRTTRFEDTSERSFALTPFQIEDHKEHPEMPTITQTVIISTS
ncbi:hypothetical protein F5890DRAFT_1575375 [Lentinula detonsa]|uniref:DUF6534 domain-containing protein n=1 Tax=Lentinula detonsa TaxID=2804962 RepID=A0AA38UNI3_9AGAR|nr:hypothetical protein F5890DRAFT_1575375 [Lentinula detonsa]